VRHILTAAGPLGRSLPVLLVGLLLGVLLHEALHNGLDAWLTTPGRGLLLVLGLPGLAIAVLWLAAARRADRADRAHALLRQAIDLVPCQFAVFDPDGTLRASNASYRSLHAKAFAAMPGRITYRDLMRMTVVQSVPAAAVEAELDARMRAHEASDGTPFERRYPDGRWMHIIKKRLPGGEVAGFAMDITSVKAAQEQVAFMARHDPLTGLANRGAFREALEAAMGARDGAALLLVDLDHFKQANDRHGHSAGDAMLVAAGHRMQAVLRDGDLVARLGGDEFAVIAPGLAAGAATQLGQRLHAALCQPVPFGDAQLPLAASLGVACAPAHALDAEALQRAADLALYAAKRAGRCGVVTFSRDLAQSQMRGSWLQAALAETIETGAGLSLAWQIQRDLRTREVLGAEALLRWHCAALDEPVSPLEALEVAAATGQALRLDLLILETALAQAAAWLGQPSAPPVIAVNITAASLRDPDLPGRVAIALARHGVPPSMLEIEIPESLATRDLEAIVPVAQALRELGVRLALDDFGGGQSSLAHALKLPVTRLKLDRSVVAGLPGAAKSRAVLRALAALARSLDIDMLAEGVETDAQVFALRREGITAVQGYLVGMPMPADQLLAPRPLVRAG
jgi:diguanylate cyclase (GGDEF)-like protein